MPTYRKGKKRFFYIHIPRTAGRFIYENIIRNGFYPEQDPFKMMEGIEVAHFPASLYKKYLDVEGIPHVAIVRNPIDRFISCSIFLKRMYGDCQELLEDSMMFSSMLDNFPLSEGVNWFRPQMDFISDETQLWKLEDGFGEDFEEWISGVVGVEIKMKKVPYKKLTTDESTKLEKSAKLIDNITSIYRKDIEQLYPELAA